MLQRNEDNGEQTAVEIQLNTKGEIIRKLADLPKLYNCMIRAYKFAARQIHFTLADAISGKVCETITL